MRSLISTLSRFVRRKSCFLVCEIFYAVFLVTVYFVISIQFTYIYTYNNFIQIIYNITCENVNTCQVKCTPCQNNYFLVMLFINEHKTRSLILSFTKTRRDYHFFYAIINACIHVFLIFVIFLANIETFIFELIYNTLLLPTYMTETFGLSCSKCSVT